MKLTPRILVLVWMSFTLNSITGAASAHDYHNAISHLVWNGKTERLEVIHRVITHDLMAAISAREGRIIIPDESRSTDLAFVRFFQQAFSIHLVDSEKKATREKPVSFQLVGYEESGDFLLIYFESEKVGDNKVLLINNRILFDAHPEQINTLNFEHDGKITTHVFLPAKPEHSIPRH